MNEIAGTWNAAVCGALLLATERGKMIAVTSEPATVVPGVASQSRPTVQPLATVPFGMPTSARASVKSAVPPPAGWTLKRYCAGAALI